MSTQVPSGDEVRASHTVLMEVLTVLGRYTEGMVLIGGWVPDIVFPRQGHIGSLDVDLALDPRKIQPAAYDSIRKRLVEEGYEQADTHMGIFTKDLPGGGTTITVKLDMVTGEEAGSSATNALVQDLSIGRLRGVEIALDHAVNITLSGALPSGAENTVTARIVTVPAYLCMKAFALNERKKEKDAYDVYFCLRHYSGGPGALAKDCLPLMAIPRGREAFGILRQKFETLNSIGPQWAADVASGQGEDRDTVARDAFERSVVLHRVLGGTEVA